MRFSILALCFSAVLVNVALAVVPATQPPKLQQPLVVAGDLQERGNQALNDDGWPIAQGDDCGDHGDWDGENDQPQPDRCPREHPLSQKGPFRVPYEFKKYNIVPEIFPEAPSHYVEVDYKNLSRHCQPKLGNNVDLCSLLNPPRVRWDCDSTTLYTLFLVDLTPYGSKHPKIGANGILWYVVDIPGCHVSAGKVISEYQMPTPFYGVGTMRYAFLVYQQPSNKIDWSEEPIVKTLSFDNRFFRCVDAISRKYALKLFAGNFFGTVYDPCLIPFRDSIDRPFPEYMGHAQTAANIPVNPYQ